MYGHIFGKKHFAQIQQILWKLKSSKRILSYFEKLCI